MVTTRQIAALICGTLSGYLIGKGLGLDTWSSIPEVERLSWAGGVLSLFAVGVVSGAVTSLVSWKHTPGLPGMAFSLAVVMLGMGTASGSAREGSASHEERWVLYSAQSLWVLANLLFTYMAAWATDTYVVFRSLPVKPPPKQIGRRLMFTRLLPCCLLTGIGGTLLSFLIPVPLLLSIPLSFAVSAGVASALFKTRSTLWYAASAPLCLALLGILALSGPEWAGFVVRQVGAPPSLLMVCGLGSAGAILGHWIWVRTARKTRQEPGSLGSET